MTHPDPLDGRPGLVTDSAAPIVASVGKLRAAHSLHGVVVITFGDERYGACSSGDGPIWSRYMRELADRLLAAIDDGQFDPDVEDDRRA